MSAALERVPPFELFGAIPDEAWGWLHLEAREQCPFLERYLPRLADDPNYLSRLVGMSGKEALGQGFELYRLFKALNDRHGSSLSPSSRVLDFGCGWGRVIRFFLREVAPENLVGIDVNPRHVAVCRETNPWSRFEPCERFPPSSLEPGDYDLVYAVSVFSHLSEEAHERWLAEFARLLKPGGVLILTTFPRELLAAGDWPEIAERFSPLEPWLAAYDRGEYCYVAESELNPHFGTTLIPEEYVRRRWARHFRIHEYFRPDVYFQSVIVCTKPPAA